MDQIRFKKGEFQEFIATRSFALGNFGVTVQKGFEIQFDGTVVVYDGSEYQFPSLRSAWTAGWIALASEYDASNPVYSTPASANIKLRSPTGEGQAKTVATTVEADERIITNASQHAENTRDRNRGTGRTVTGNAGLAEAQDGVPVGRNFKTAAVSKTSLTQASAALHAAKNVQIEAGEGLSEPEMLEKMSAEDRAVYLAQKDAFKARYVDLADEQQPKKVGRVETAKVVTSDGMTSKQTVGGGVETADLGGGRSTGKPKVATRVEDGITFTTTNGPEKKDQVHPRSAAERPVMQRDGTADVRRQIAKQVCPDFPDAYDFAAPERKKMARLQADFEDRPDVLRAVFAAESDDFKKKLVDEFPQAFQA